MRLLLYFYQKIISVEEAIRQAVLRDWNFIELERGLRGQKWRETEPGRIDRMLWVADDSVIERGAKNAVSKEDWDQAVLDGMEGEIVDDYMEALAEALIDKMKEHVYAFFEGGDAYIGQYEDIPAEHLRQMGFEIEGVK